MVSDEFIYKSVVSQMNKYSEMLLLITEQRLKGVENPDQDKKIEKTIEKLDRYLVNWSTSEYRKRKLDPLVYEQIIAMLKIEIDALEMVSWMIKKPKLNYLDKLTMTRKVTKLANLAVKSTKKNSGWDRFGMSCLAGSIVLFILVVFWKESLAIGLIVGTAWAAKWGIISGDIEDTRLKRTFARVFTIAQRKAAAQQA